MKIENQLEKSRIIKKVLSEVKDYEHKYINCVLIGENGEYIGEYLMTNKEKDILISSKENNKYLRKVCPPFSSISKNSKIIKEYIDIFTQLERGYLLNLMLKIDAFGRIKCGDNFQQYCRSYEDLAKAVGISYSTFRRNFLPKLKSNDIIREINIKNSYDTERYISFNPALVTGGNFYDRLEILVWKDIILKYQLLTEKQVKEILKDDNLIDNVKEKKKSKDIDTGGFKHYD